VKGTDGAITTPKSGILIAPTHGDCSVLLLDVPSVVNRTNNSRRISSDKTKHVVRDLDETRRNAYAQFYYSPYLLANVAVRNWRFLYDLGLAGGAGSRGSATLSMYVRVRSLVWIRPSLAPIFPPYSP
jgi:hypothetical protein